MDYKFVNIFIHGHRFFVCGINNVSYKPILLKSIHPPWATHKLIIDYNAPNAVIGLKSIITCKNENQNYNEKCGILKSPLISKNYDFYMEESRCVDYIHDIHRKQRIVNKMIQDLITKGNC